MVNSTGACKRRRHGLPDVDRALKHGARDWCPDGCPLQVHAHGAERCAGLPNLRDGRRDVRDGLIVFRARGIQFGRAQHLTADQRGRAIEIQLCLTDRDLGPRLTRHRRFQRRFGLSHIGLEPRRINLRDDLALGDARIEIRTQLRDHARYL